MVPKECAEYGCPMPCTTNKAFTECAEHGCPMQDELDAQATRQAKDELCDDSTYTTGTSY